ncbi:hypothetical protein HUJ05_008801 [Dendroctonus ponderosae]|nr:hypothetical protein HUJ05_008801 [Dendroctonus ponderosae]
MKIWKSLNIAIWNVRGLLEAGKLAIVEKEIRNHSIVGLAKTHWKGLGLFKSRNNIIFSSGTEGTSRNSVTIEVNMILEKSNARPVNLNIVQVYFPTKDARDEEVENAIHNKNSYWRLPNRETPMIIGDYKAKIGRELGDEHLRKVIGKYGLGERNTMGERLLLFRTENNFFITNTAGC